MADDYGNTIKRRELITHAVPSCAAAYFGLCGLPGIAALAQEPEPQEQHKFDIKRDVSLSSKQRLSMEYSQLFDFIGIMKREMGEDELIQLLNKYSAGIGRRAGENQRRNSPDDRFQTFVATFRPPRYANSLTHEVVEDSEKAFGLRVTECIWATVFREAGFDGEIGHAALCNMDYYWPSAFNPNFAMERTRTLMQGHDHCNHRYIDKT